MCGATSSKPRATKSSTGQRSATLPDELSLFREKDTTFSQTFYSTLQAQVTDIGFLTKNASELILSSKERDGPVAHFTITSFAKNVQDEQLFSSYFSQQDERCRGCIIILDEIYIKASLTYQGGVVFGYSVDQPDKFATTLLCIMFKCFFTDLEVFFQLGQRFCEFASWKDITDLHDHESNTLVKLSKLTKASVCPSSIEKQKVSLVMNIFNEHTSSALRSSEKSCPSWCDTEDFIDSVIQLWKTLNCQLKWSPVDFEILIPRSLTTVLRVKLQLESCWPGR
ncbi:traf-interacting protein [Plakobranchus ocellatus]|uniref:Traf-interacting protein n=1 Tax=Plakobranchus ocellatus TaxID=259542 RepID=A0AAV3YSF9_9GAST|nr:traf-interacting protein [Plakobranchus ocellatus]